MFVSSSFRYDEKMEELLDQAYELFVSKKEGSAKQQKRARKAHSEDIELLEVQSAFHLVEMREFSRAARLMRSYVFLRFLQTFLSVVSSYYLFFSFS